jgi:hypothetical protein
MGKLKIIGERRREGTCDESVRKLSRAERRGESQKRDWVCPLSWSVHYNLAGEGYMESTCCCVQARFLGMETKKLFSL